MVRSVFGSIWSLFLWVVAITALIILVAGIGPAANLNRQVATIGGAAFGVTVGTLPTWGDAYQVGSDAANSSAEVAGTPAP